MNESLSWYKKKRFLIPIGALSVFTALGIISDTDSTTVQQSKQIAPIVRQQEVPSHTQALPQTRITKPVESLNRSTRKPNTSASQLSNNNYYNNIDGNSIHSPAYTEDHSIPTSASAKCGDGTYSFSQNRKGTCSHHGGVAVWY